MSREALVPPERLRRSKAEARSAPTSACSPASRTTPASARRLGSTDPSLVGSSSLVAQGDSSAQLGERVRHPRGTRREIVPERHSRGRQSLRCGIRNSGGARPGSRSTSAFDRASVSGRVDRARLGIDLAGDAGMTDGTAVLGLTIANRLGPRRPGAHERTAAQCWRRFEETRGDTNV